MEQVWRELITCLWVPTGWAGVWWITMCRAGPAHSWWFPWVFLPCTCSQLITAEPAGFETLHWGTTSKAVYNALLISCSWKHCQCEVKLTLPKDLKAEAFWLFSRAKECWCCCHLQAKWQVSWKWVSSGCCRTYPLPCLHFYSFVKLTGILKRGEVLIWKKNCPF